MHPSVTLTMVDGVRIVVPDSLESITPYVLIEQQDWFEDEIKFLRRLLQAGQKVIDVGANYGVYTLSMAWTVGPGGTVWAFEPASSTAALLAQGIAANDFAQIVLERSALSSTCGTARLSLNDHSELNALMRSEHPANASEAVSLTTLDACLQRYGWQDIAFMKIDAEGEEANILKGGARFFAELSPLIQYEIKVGEELNLDLARDFAALGYASYRLVPGLDLLVPFDTESVPDGYLLNLFCCKNDRAEQLAIQGFLLESESDPANRARERYRDISATDGSSSAYAWRNTIAKLPYGVQLAGLWERTMAAGNRAAVDEALSYYAISRGSGSTSAERFGALEASFKLFKSLCESQPAHLRLASLARVARDYGARSVAVSALMQLGEIIFKHKQVDLSEPFLAPVERFDSIRSGDDIANRVAAAVLEGIEQLGSFSSFYTGVSARRRLETIASLGFGSEEMGRRSRLLERRFGLRASGSPG